MNRPVITEFMGDEFTLDKAHKQYLENLELWNYVQVLDAYVDELEEQTQLSHKFIGGVNYRRELLLDFMYWDDEDLHPADAHNIINKYDDYKSNNCS